MSGKKLHEFGKKTSDETILLFCAHPDDEIIGAGGTIAQYSREGKKVITVIFSYGENSHWWLKKRHMVETRVKESKSAGRIVGTSETIFLGLKDFELKSELEKEGKIQIIEKLIEKYSPSKIFTHSPDDMIYQDHLAVWNAIDRATDNIGYKGDVFVFNIWAKDIRVGQNPKLYVDISDTFRLKWIAMKCFKSQMLSIYQLAPGVIWHAFRQGLANKTRFAEVFVKVK